jgi:hypothetical protein
VEVCLVAHRFETAIEAFLAAFAVFVFVFDIKN